MLQFLRTITSFIRVLVALFLIAQFAGVVPMSLASAGALGHPVAVASAVPDHHVDGHSGHATFHHHGDQNGDRVDHCCALHAFFAAILPPPIAVHTEDVAGRRLVAELADAGRGVDLDQLGRPPRPVP